MTQKYKTMGEICLEMKTKLESSVGELLKDIRDYIIIDYPSYNNIGDHLIYMATNIMAGELSGRYPIDVILSKSRPDQLIHIFKKDIDTILINGGGNFGSIYETLHKRKLEWINYLSCKRIIQLPQTICFNNKDDNDELLNETCRVIEKAKDFTFIARDIKSLEFCKKHFPCKCIIAPDMAFYMFNQRDIQLKNDRDEEILKNDIYEILRSDKESKNNQHIKDIWAEDNTFSRKYMYTLRKAQRSGWRIVKLLNYYSMNRIKYRKNIISKSDIIISDRLHVHISCLLAGKKHIMIDNIYGKISSFMKTWKTITTESMLINDINEAWRLAEKIYLDNRG